MDTAIPNFGKVEYFCEEGLTGFWWEAGVLPDGLVSDAASSPPQSDGLRYVQLILSEPMFL
jgi:hypothetical protein